VRLMHLTKYAAIAGALATPLAFVAPASATTGGSSSAFGLSASGLVNIPQTPAVSSATQPNNKSLAELPLNPLAELKILHVGATAGHARASVVDLKVAKAALSAHLITAKCAGGKGSSHLVKASLAGHRLAVNPAPNSALSAPVQGLGTVSVVLNKQVHNADGGLTVTAIELNLPIAPGKTQTISISSATCGGGSVGSPGDPGSPGGPTASPSPSPTSSTPPGEAPKPTPVPGDLPVTG
jgi:hypothetical protein